MTRRVAVVYPEAAAEHIEQFRQRWDPLAGQVAAHVTIAHPFDDDRDSEALSKAMTEAVSDVCAFRLRLGTPTATDDNYVFLLACEGAEEVKDLHDRLYRGPLRGLPRPLAFIPHMTVGRCQEEKSAKSAVREAEQLDLSLIGLASVLTVYEIKADGLRSQEFQISLR